MSSPAQRRAAALEQQIAELRVRVEALEHDRSRRPAPEDDAVLLSTVAASIGSAAFTGADLVKLAALDRAVAAVISGANAREIGLRLRRIARRPVEGYRLQRVKRVNDGQLWTVALV